MTPLQPPRGTHDLLPDEVLEHQKIISLARETAKQFGFSEMQTPIFEFQEVFAKTLGHSSDIVGKEMYTFQDRGDNLLSLRPEGTASVARSFISNKLYQQIPLKIFYQGPMFRYERPQKGRLRQFHQVGVELLGTQNSQADIDVICSAYLFLKKLNIKTQLNIHTLGDKESRKVFREKLISYYKENEKYLSEESQKRLKTNPFRILDSKDKTDQKINEQAPDMRESLNEVSKNLFTEILSNLDAYQIKYNINKSLVRGLDYYCHTVFEFTSEHIGAQNTVLGGGRYDSLIELMGGPPTPGLGWAAGVERLNLLKPKQESKQNSQLVFVIPQKDSCLKQCALLSYQLRSQGFFVEMNYTGNFKKRLQKAIQAQAHIALILGEEEIKKDYVTIKTLSSREQMQCSRKELVNKLKVLLNSNIITS